MTKGQKIPKREISLDILRMAATCAVVLLHTISGVTDTRDMASYPLQERIFAAVQDIITWCVPVFIMISGYLFLQPERDFTFFQMLKKYCMRIVLALVLFGVPYAFMELVVRERAVHWGMLPKAFLMVTKGETWSHMWYLYLIFFLYFITPAMRWCLKRLPRSVIYAGLLIILMGSSIFTFLNKYHQNYFFPMLPDWAIYFFYYVCGYLFACKKGSLHMDKKAAGGTKYVLPIAMVVLVAGMILSRMVYDFHVEMAYNYPPIVLLTLFLFYFVTSRDWELSEGATCKLLGFNRLSFAIYLVHPVFLNLCYKFLQITPLDFWIGISLPLFWLGTLVLSGAVAWLLRKLPLLCKYVL